MRKLFILPFLAFLLMLSACTETTFKADTYTAKTLTGTLREYAELPKCTDELLTACRTPEVTQMAADAAKKWKESNTAYKKATEDKVGVAAAKAANDVSLAALKAVAESEPVIKALAGK